MMYEAKQTGFIICHHDLFSFAKASFLSSFSALNLHMFIPDLAFTITAVWSPIIKKEHISKDISLVI